ncbi:serine hydrolase domain-containing protein [Levilactobacillus hammesii]|uniref:Beta-lactamase class C related penicillin binding protein n=1 Tax=Levilactobacillus hammesii DSM 16381 TaxID=1423753 RepID=A0A0R1UWJ0_9LACO|nr:serine hydrolase domain-containing protein [Levilactobacillus hammesii]KRL95314.1 Beta-lactamase class C related penicillin binding protein [Levilactobacillus hammesii DSM 16381]
MNKRNLGHWGILFVVVLGISGVVFGMHVLDTNDQQTMRTTNKLHAKQTRQEIAYDALRSAQQRTNKKKSALDKKNLGKKTPKFSAKFTKDLKAKKFVGTALVVKNNKVVYQRSFGKANAKKHKANQATSQFLINSIQKSMTGILVMRAAQAGQLHLTDKLSKYYPQIKGSNKVTLRQMLDMEAGITGELKPETTLTEPAVYKYASQQAKINPAKINQFNYQPISYTLLAGILRKVTHESYYQLFYEHVVTPLSLNHTSFAQLKHTGTTIGYSGTVPGNYSQPHVPSAKDMAVQIATGNATMSAGDVFRTERAIIQGTLLKKAGGANTLHRSASMTAHYAGGLYHLDRIGYYGHGVGDDYEGTFVLSRNGKTGVILLSNNYYKRGMYPTWSTEDLAMNTFRNVVAVNKLS